MCFLSAGGLDYAISLEGSLKLKEISYIHSEAYAAGELKHGTISLIEEGTPVFAVATQDKLFEKTLGNIKEVKARGASVIALVTDKHASVSEFADEVIRVPSTDGNFFTSLNVIPLHVYSLIIWLCFAAVMLISREISQNPSPWSNREYCFSYGFSV